MEKNALGKAKEKQVRPQRKEDISQTQMKTEFYQPVNHNKEGGETNVLQLMRKNNRKKKVQLFPLCRSIEQLGKMQGKICALNVLMEILTLNIEYQESSNLISNNFPLKTKNRVL